MRQRRSSGGRPGRTAAVVLVTTVATATAGCGAARTVPSASATEARQDDAGLVSGLGAGPWSFRAPAAIAATGTRVWVADQGANAVYELSARTGALIRIISGRRYRLSGPDAIAASGSGVWVASGGSNTVTELNAATGGLVRVISAPGDRLSVPTGLAVAGGHVWVASGGSNLVTELSEATGRLIRVIRGAPYRFETLTGLAAAGGRVWVPSGGASVTEISASTGGLIRSLGGSRYGFDSTNPVAVRGGQVFVGSSSGSGSPGGTGGGGNSVTELSAATGAPVHVTGSLPSRPMAIAAGDGTAWVAMNAGAKGSDGGGPHGAIAEISARTGALIRVISSPRYRVGDPQSVAISGGHVWVATAGYPGPGGSVTEISAATGKLIRVVPGSKLSS